MDCYIKRNFILLFKKILKFSIIYNIIFNKIFLFIINSYIISDNNQNNKKFNGSV